MDLIIGYDMFIKRHLKFFKREYSDFELISLLKAKDDVILYWIYENHFPLIRKMIWSMYGTKEEARDVFQDTLVVIIEKIQKPDFQLSCAFSTFLYAIGQNIWLKKIRSRRNIHQGFIDMDSFGTSLDFDEFDKDVIKLAEKKIFWKHFDILKIDCRKILELTIKQYSDLAIAGKIGLKCKEDVIKRRSRCKQYLIRSVRQDPMFNEVFNHG